MGKVRKSDTEIDESILEKLYYYQVWKTRLDWTGHRIPARAKHPSGYFFVEVYIDTPSKIEKTDQKIEVSMVYDTVRCVNTINVGVREIYPSARIITRLSDDAVLVPMEPNWPILEKYPLKNLDAIFDTLRDVDFTIPELEAMLNNEISDAVETLLVPKSKKSCIITNEILSTHIKINKPTLSFEDEVNFPMEPVYNSPKDLFEAYKACDRCSLGTRRIERNVGEPTFGRNGDIPLEKFIPGKELVLFLGEAPGVQEEEHKIAFYPEAPAASILHKVIKAAQIPLESCYFTNAVLCRPECDTPGVSNAAPTKDYIKACNTRLKNEIALVRPKVIVILGKSAYTSFFGVEPKSILSMAGWLPDIKNVYFVPHPSYIARELGFAVGNNNLSIKARYLEHFKKIKERFDSNGS